MGVHSPYSFIHSLFVLQHAERVFRVSSAVTSLSFSTAHPNLLAVSGVSVSVWCEGEDEWYEDECEWWEGEGEWWE